MRRWPLLLLAGCRIHFDSLDPQDAAGAGDALGSWSTPARVPTVNAGAAGDDDPALPSDMLELIFDSERMGAASSLYSARRADLASPWSAPVLIAEIESAADEDGPVLSSDGLTLTFSSERAGTAGLSDLYITTRADRDSAWASPTRIPELCSSVEDEHLTIAPDGLTAWFNRGPGTNYSIMVTTRATTTAVWSPPVAVAELNTSSDDEDPTLAADALVMYFSSGRTGNSALFTAMRPTPTDAWTAITRIVELDTSADELDPWVAPDQRTIYFVRGTGNMRDIFTSTR